MRSQVHIQPLPQVQVPDNTQTLNLMQRLGDQLGTMRKEKEATELTNQLMNNESREDALKSQAIMAEEETAINQVREKAQTAQSAVRSQSRIKSMMNDQDQRQAFMRLHKIDPNAARMVMSVFAAEDEEQKQILAQEAHAARVFNQNVMGLNANGQHDDAKAVLMAKAKQVNDAGVPPEQNEYLQMANYSPEQLQQALLAKQSLAGEAIKIAEKQGFINVSEGTDVIDASGNLVYSNEKEVDHTDMYLKQQQLSARMEANELEREKFEASQSKLSAAAEKVLMTAQDEATASERQSGELMSLAQEFDNLQAAGGSRGRFVERMKQFSGSEDAVTNLRKRYLSLRNSQAVKNLPPGVASDKDIEMVLSGFLSETANPQQISSFLRGMAKIEQHNAKYQSFKANWLSDRGNTRGMLSAWKEQNHAQQPQAQTKPIVARNPNTGQTIVSHDGGKTWQAQ